MKMEYEINVGKVEKRATKRPLNPKYREMPKEWVGKFIVTIFSDQGRDGYLDLFKQKVFDKKEDMIEFTQKFIKSRRKTTEITISGQFKKEV